MTAWAVLLLMLAAAAGWGGMVLAVLGLRCHLPATEHPVWAVILGMGLLGWLLFFPGLVGQLTPSTAFALCVVGLPGLWLLRHWRFGPLPPPSAVEWALLAALTLLMGLDVLETWSPAADADSMAYHFANIRDILHTGFLPFTARAVDGAIPQLLHLTYLPALGLGGEHGLTLWCMVTGWSGAGLAFVLARRHLSRPWALAVAVVFLGTPAIIYGAGTGQMEARLAALVLGAAFAAAMSRNGVKALPMAVLAGLLAGFAAGAKLTGLLSVAVCGLVILTRRGGWRPALAFALAALVAGGQWYAWTWWKSGDPVFPMLWPLLHYDNGLWNQGQQAYFADVVPRAETVLPRSLFWWLAYPVYASLTDHPIFESGRTGLGILPLLLAPFALVGLWLGRKRVAGSELLPVAVVALLIYTLWFFLGPSQRVRHLLPLLPLVLIVLTVAAQRAVAALPGLRLPLMAAFAATMALQMAAAGVFSGKFIRGLGSDRDTFLAANVAGYDAVRWINANLPPDARLGTPERQLIYLVDRPIFQLNPVFQAQVELRPEMTDQHRFARQLAGVGVTHLLYAENLLAEDVAPIQAMSEALIHEGCAAMIRRFPLVRIGSRSLPGLSTVRSELALVALTLPCSPLAR